MGSWWDWEERKTGRADWEKLKEKKMLVVLMKQKNRCCDNKKVRGLEKEQPQVKGGGQICLVQRCGVLGNGTV